MGNDLSYTDNALIKGMKVDPVAPLNPYAYGYGPKIPTEYWVQYDNTNRWRRVWVMCYGNSGSAYIIVDGKDVFLDSDTEHDLEDFKKRHIAITPEREEALSIVMDFSRPIEVLDNGNVIPCNEDAPELYMDVDSEGSAITTDAELMEQVSTGGWTLLTGFTGQYGYNGPVMHASELIGGGIARHILMTPGIYVALVVECLSPDDDQDEGPAGWAVATKPSVSRTSDTHGKV